MEREKLGTGHLSRTCHCMGDLEFPRGILEREKSNLPTSCCRAPVPVFGCRQDER